MGPFFMVEIDVKDDFLLKNEVLPCKNVNFVYKGIYPKIPVWGCLLKCTHKYNNLVKRYKRLSNWIKSYELKLHFYKAKLHFLAKSHL